jgi:HK97 family phage portal protein
VGRLQAWVNSGALRAGTPSPIDDYWYEPYPGGGSSSGVRVSADSAKRISAVFACVSIISRNVATLPLKLYQERSDGGKEVASRHPLYDVLYSTPNRFQTSSEFRQMMQGHFELRGNAYAEITPGPRGFADQLIPMHPDRVVVTVDSRGMPVYKYSDPRTNQSRTLVSEEVFHLKGWSDDGITGQSTLALGADVFGVAIAAQDYSARYFANDATPPVYITGANFKDDTARDKFKENLQREQTGRNRHKAAVLPIGLDIKSLDIKASDAQLLEARKYSRIEICSMFGVPPHMIGETDKAATYASVEQFNISFAVQCLLPRLVTWEQAITRDLIIVPKYFPKFSMAALLRGNTAERFAAYKIAIENGWMCQDDVRMLEDMNPIPNGVGAKFWRPLNWAPLEQLENPKQHSLTRPLIRRKRWRWKAELSYWRPALLNPAFAKRSTKCGGCMSAVRPRSSGRQSATSTASMPISSRTACIFHSMSRRNTAIAIPAGSSMLRSRLKSVRNSISISS